MKTLEGSPEQSEHYMVRLCSFPSYSGWMVWIGADVNSQALYQHQLRGGTSDEAFTPGISVALSPFILPSPERGVHVNALCFCAEFSASVCATVWKLLGILCPTSLLIMPQKGRTWKTSKLSVEREQLSTYFAVYNAHPTFLAQALRERIFQFLNSIIYLFIIFRNKTNYHIPGYYFVYRNYYCFLELHFSWISINKRIKNIYIDTELVLPMYNAHPYFSLKNLGKKVHLIYNKNPVTRGLLRNRRSMLFPRYQSSPPKS